MEHISKTIKRTGNTENITHKLMNNPDALDDNDSENTNDCEICHGFGWVHPKINGKPNYSDLVPCRCRKKIITENLNKRLIKYCELPPKSEDMNFQNFKVYPELKTAFNMASKIASNPEDLFWIIFLGENGVGKTHLGISICNELISKGIITKYIYAPLLLDELREGYHYQDDKSYFEISKRYRDTPVLFLDDLGKVFPDESEHSKTSSWAREKIETLLDYRYMHKLSLIVTSNKPLNELPEGIASRLVRPEYRIVIELNTIDYALRKH